MVLYSRSGEAGAGAGGGAGCGCKWSEQRHFLQKSHITVKNGWQTGGVGGARESLSLRLSSSMWKYPKKGKRLELKSERLTLGSGAKNRGFTTDQRVGVGWGPLTTHHRAQALDPRFFLGLWEKIYSSPLCLELPFAGSGPSDRHPRSASADSVWRKPDPALLPGFVSVLWFVSH